MNTISAELNDILGNFGLREQAVSAETFGNGHINSTYCVTCVSESGEEKYILQKINTNVFKNPDQLMDNIFRVTDYLRQKAVERGGDPTRETLTFLRTTDGNTYAKINGESWRIYRMVQGACSFEAATPELFGRSAEAFGRFQKLLAAFPAETLYETIPNFHNTVSRFADFEKAIAENKAGRLAEVQPEIAFMLARKKEAGVALDAMKDGKMPVRVTHNDTKLNNILMDDQTGEGICIIDLDTIMPGSSLYDFGDSIRFGASSAAEDEKDLDKVFMRLDLFEAFVKGFLKETGDVLTPEEKELLPYGAKLMTLECGIRFLGDYLNGDIYFATHYPEQNLDRARTQIKLIADMEAKWEQMQAIVRKYS